MSTDLLISHPHSTAKKNAENDRKKVKGLTLKEYFRLCRQEQLKEIKEESVQSSKSSLVQTPSFPHDDTQPKQFIRFRTQASDGADDLLPILPCELAASNRTPPLKNPRTKEHSFRGQPPQQRKKVLTKVPHLSEKHQFQSKKRSTMSCFYRIQHKQKKMLRKLQADKEKAEEMTLREALCITKYGRLKTECKY